jgi:Sulfotransferase domain
MHIPDADSLERTIAPADISRDQRPWLRRYRSWRRFHRGPRRGDRPLLKNLARYPDCVLVAGCQRSGTTMLTRIIAHSRGFQPFALTHDDELDAALILGGYVDVPQDRRYCFQTTYLNERYEEYRNLAPGQRLIWVLRNPYSVVFSMVYNWRRFALNELYEGCGALRTPPARVRRSWLPWPIGPSRVEKACFAYSCKTSQILSIRELVHPEQVMVVEYDELVQSPHVWLPRLFAFVGEAYDSSYATRVRTNSVGKADRLSARLKERIRKHAAPAYERCLALTDR